MLTNSHDDAKNKSFLKSGLNEYLATLPLLAEDKLKTMFEND